jgi:hypothetical protein
MLMYMSLKYGLQLFEQLEAEEDGWVADRSEAFQKRVGL